MCPSPTAEKSAASSSSSTPTSTPASSTSERSESFFTKAKRRLSFNVGKLTHPDGEGLTAGPLVDEPSETVLDGMPGPAHRESLVLHAVLDSLPKLPPISFHALAHPSTLFKYSPANSLHTSPTSEDDSTPLPNLRKTSLDLESPVDPFLKLSGNVVVLGGYRGSILRDAKNGRRLWCPLRMGLGIRKVDLSIGLTEGDELASTETIVPGKMLMSVGGVIDLGKRLKDKLKSLEANATTSPVAGVAPVKFHNWGYDWRRSLELSSAELLHFLEGLKKESAARGEGKNGEGEGATVLAHSMGGLVLQHALSIAADPSVFKGIIYAGVPFAGCINVLSPFRRGDGVLFNTEICSPRAVFSMRSSFYFLPPTSICFEGPTGELLPVDFYDPVSWSTHRISPVTGSIFSPDSLERSKTREFDRREMETDSTTSLVSPLEDSVRDLTQDGLEPNLARTRERDMSGVEEMEEDDETDETGLAFNWEKGQSATSTPIPATASPCDASIAEYLVRTLNKVQAFHRTLATSYDPARQSTYPPIALILSGKTPTVRGSIVPSLESIASDSTYESLLFGPGDGIVLRSSSEKLPGEWDSCLRGTVESSAGHGGLLSDLAAVRQAIDILYSIT